MPPLFFVFISVCRLHVSVLCFVFDAFYYVFGIVAFCFYLVFAIFVLSFLRFRREVVVFLSFVIYFYVLSTWSCVFSWACY